VEVELYAIICSFICSDEVNTKNYLKSKVCFEFMMFRYASISITAIATISIGVPFVKMRKPQLKQYSFLMSSLLLQSTAYCTSVSPSPHASSEGSPRSASLSIQDTDKLSFIDSTTAKDIDDKLMSDLGFKLEQLMELAGIS
jgi:hypothetical protein